MLHWFAVVILFLCSPAWSASFLFNKPADTPQSRYIIDVMTQVYSNLGLELSIVEFNHRSSLVAANEGLLDGQLGRVIEVEQQYPNLIRIPVPIFAFSLQLVTSRESAELNDIEKMVITEGYQAIDTYLAQHLYTQQLFKVKNISTQLNLLAQRKVDGALVISFHIPPAFKEQNQNVWYFRDLNTVKVYHYIHKKHAPLAVEIETELLRLIANGTVAEMQLKYKI